MFTDPVATPGAIEWSAAANRRSLIWTNWNAALLLLCATFLLRVAYLAFLSPYELVGDEAYYWEQSRHLAGSYNEKGPALPWMIAGCRKVFGDTELAVRFPMALSALLAGWGIGRLAMSVAGGEGRIGFLAVLAFCVIPAFHANAQISTQDGPLIALWVALSAIGLALVRRWHAGLNPWPQWLLFWLVLGVGFLFKQSILLFLPGMAIYWLIERRALRINLTWIAQQVAGIVLFTLIVSPMIIWNARHGWPLVAHTLGHLGAGGDQTGHINRGNSLTWLGITIGGIAGAIGPVCVAMMLWGSIRALRLRRADRARWRDQLWIICAGWTSVLFFILLSVVKPVVPSWPLVSFVVLIPFIAEMGAVELPRYEALVSIWRRMRSYPDAPQRRRPDTPFHQLWWTFIVYGIAGCLLLSFPNVLARLPLIGARLQHSLFHRFSGHRAAAHELDLVRATVATPDHRPPMIVAPYYMDAALLAFYLPDHPPVATAGKYFGRRSTTFDQWPDTDLENQSLLGRTILLVGPPDIPWDRALSFGRLEPVAGGRCIVGINYRGPQPGAAHLNDRSE